MTYTLGHLIPNPISVLYSVLVAVLGLAFFLGNMGLAVIADWDDGPNCDVVILQCADLHEIP